MEYEKRRADLLLRLETVSNLATAQRAQVNYQHTAHQPKKKPREIKPLQQKIQTGPPQAGTAAVGWLSPLAGHPFPNAAAKITERDLLEMSLVNYLSEACTTRDTVLKILKISALYSPKDNKRPIGILRGKIHLNYPQTRGGFLSLLDAWLMEVFIGQRLNLQNISSLYETLVQMEMPETIAVQTIWWLLLREGLDPSPLGRIYPEETAKIRRDSFPVSQACLEIVIEQQESAALAVKVQEAEKKIKQLQQEVNQQRKQVESYRQQAAQAYKVAERLKGENKLLREELDGLLELSTAETEQLSAQLEAEKKAHQEETAALLQELLALQQEAPSPQAPKTKQLSGKTVCIVGGVGDARQKYYQGIVEDYGAKSIWCPGFEQYNKITGAVNAADFIIFVTNACSHGALKMVTAAARVPVYYFSCTGVTGFQRNLADLVEELAPC